MSTTHEARIRIGAWVCVIVGMLGWLRFGVGLGDGLSFSMDPTLLLLPVGMGILNAGSFWRGIMTTLLALLMLILVVMTGILVAMDPGVFSASLTTNIDLSPGLLRAGMIVLQMVYMASVVFIYFSMIERRNAGGTS